jgi:hypothetical protein
MKEDFIATTDRVPLELGCHLHCQLKPMVFEFPVAKFAIARRNCE